MRICLKSLEGVSHSIVGIKKGPFIITLARPEIDLTIIEMDVGDSIENLAGERNVSRFPIYGKPEIYDPLDRREPLFRRKTKNDLPI